MTEPLEGSMLPENGFPEKTYSSKALDSLIPNCSPVKGKSAKNEKKKNIYIKPIFNFLFLAKKCDIKISFHKNFYFKRRLLEWNEHNIKEITST
jgi:hypothetical protein